MKISTFLGFCLLASVNLQSTHGYVASPQQYGRTFDLFNLFPFVDNSYATLSSRISALESSIAATNTQVASLLNLVQSLSFAIQSLRTQLVAANAPKCSAKLAALGGKVIGNFCYTLGTTAKIFADAQADCVFNGGTLAEPATATTVAASKAFYDSVKSAFDPTFTTAVGATNLWIGLKRANAVILFTFISTTPFTAVVADIFEPAGSGSGTGAGVAAGADEAATLKSNGKYVNEKQTETKNYICQFPAF